MTEAQQFAFASLTRGDLFPWATIRDAARVKFGFHTLGGRYLVFCFFGSATHPGAQGALAALERHRQFFDDTRACFFGIGFDAEDKASGRVQDVIINLYLNLPFRFRRMLPGRSRTLPLKCRGTRRGQHGRA